MNGGNDILDFFRSVHGRSPDAEVPPPEVPHGTAPWSEQAKDPKPAWKGGSQWTRPRPAVRVEISASASVAEARAAMYERTHLNGIPGACPVCDHWDEVYARRFHAEAAQFVRALVELWRNEAGWYHMKDIVPGGPKHSSDGPYLGLHYGLVERMSNTDDRPKVGRSTGYYRPTKFAMQFVDGEMKIPEFVLVSNRGNQAVGWSPERMSIDGALKLEPPAVSAVG